MITLAQSERGIPLLPEQLDCDPWLLNVANGTLDLRTGTRQAPRREDLLTKYTAVDHDPDARCPHWDAFLRRIMANNTNMIEFLQRAIGYALTGDCREQVLFLLYGTGANGKSTFLEVVRALLGTYAAQTDFTTFLARSSDTVRNDLARLAGARFVTAVEAEDGRRLDEALVKQLTGGDRITARFLFEEFFEFDPQFKLFLATNHKPVIWSTGHSIWRRIRLIPFTVTIPEAEQDRTLPATLRTELPGILNWALQGCLTWQRGGLGVPKEVEDATQDYRTEMDVIADFLAGSCVWEPGAKVARKVLYETYEVWSARNGERPLSSKVFSKLLKEHGLTQTKVGHNKIRSIYRTL